MINLMIIYDVVNIFSMKNYQSSRKLRVGVNWYPGVNWSITTSYNKSYYNTVDHSRMIQAFRYIEISKYDDGGQLTTRGQLMQGSSSLFRRNLRGTKPPDTVGTVGHKYFHKILSVTVTYLRCISSFIFHYYTPKHK